MVADEADHNLSPPERKEERPLAAGNQPRPGQRCHRGSWDARQLRMVKVAAMERVVADGDDNAGGSDDSIGDCGLLL
ncbi:hypothetical protein Dsin_029190 [Dipteronia sinensis]|uniref:Uncharacterized protein n=1 Tax=Dipteronia sinensis TaxID=43782 RepID=A0AAD9ZSK6_9ROSI|nr:hypothetical protein Dsin_029190 [Dipteronia sinensis]